MQTKNKFPWGEGREWKSRTELIASLITPKKKVIDLGCGYCHLKKYVEIDTYLGVDLDKWVPDIFVNDFNLTGYPNLGKFDFIVCQGILEYIDEPRQFLQQIRKYGDTLLLTYKQFSPSDIERRNILEMPDLIEQLSMANWEIHKNIKVDGNQRLLVCKKI